MDYWMEYMDHWVYNLIKIDHVSCIRCILCSPENAILGFGTCNDYIMRTNITLQLLQCHEEVAKKAKARHEKVFEAMLAIAIEIGSFHNPLFVNLLCALMNSNEN